MYFIFVNLFRGSLKICNLMFILLLVDFLDFLREYSSYRGFSESIGKFFSFL